MSKVILISFMFFCGVLRADIVVKPLPSTVTFQLVSVPGHNFENAPVLDGAAGAWLSAKNHHDKESALAVESNPYKFDYEASKKLEDEIREKLGVYNVDYLRELNKVNSYEAQEISGLIIKRVVSDLGFTNSISVYESNIDNKINIDGSSYKKTYSIGGPGPQVQMVLDRLKGKDFKFRNIRVHPLDADVVSLEVSNAIKEAHAYINRLSIMMWSTLVGLEDARSSNLFNSKKSFSKFLAIDWDALSGPIDNLDKVVSDLMPRHLANALGFPKSRASGDRRKITPAEYQAINAVKHVKGKLHDLIGYISSIAARDSAVFERYIFTNLRTIDARNQDFRNEAQSETVLADFDKAEKVKTVPRAFNKAISIRLQRLIGAYSSELLPLYSFAFLMTMESVMSHRLYDKKTLSSLELEPVLFSVLGKYINNVSKVDRYTAAALSFFAKEKSFHPLIRLSAIATLVEHIGKKETLDRTELSEEQLTNLYNDVNERVLLRPDSETFLYKPVIDYDDHSMDVSPYIKWINKQLSVSLPISSEKNLYRKSHKAEARRKAENSMSAKISRSKAKGVPVISKAPVYRPGEKIKTRSNVISVPFGNGCAISLL